MQAMRHISLLARFTFLVSVVGLALFFIFGSQHIRIDTNLNDLNPNREQDAGLKFATEEVLKDISRRFIIVVKGSDQAQVNQAVQAFKGKLSQINTLQVQSNEHIQERYLDALQVYRFNLLTNAQRESIASASIDAMANDAVRRLYQLGDGIRLIPFEQDPLGSFSDYLLSRFDELSANNQVVQDTQDRQETPFFESFNVLIKQYPAGMAEQETLYQAIKRIEEEVRTQYEVTNLHSGMFFFAVDSAQTAKGDIQLIAIGSIVGVITLMLLVFRSLLPLCLSLGSIAIGVGFGVLTNTLVFGSIHVLTIVFGASLIGIVVDYSLHYFYHFLSKPTHIRGTAHESSGALAHDSGRSLKKAMMLSVLTSLIGYAALGLSDLVILKKVALFSCSGLLMAWLSVMLLGPYVSKRPIVARQALLMKLIRGIQKVFSVYPKVLIALGIVCSIAGGLYLYTADIKVNDDPRLFFHVSPDLLAQEQAVAELTQVYEPGRYLVVKGLSSQDVYSELEDLYQALGTSSQQLSSVIDWLPSPSEQKQNYAAQQSLYETDGVIDVFYQRLGYPSAQAQPIKQQYAQANGRILDFNLLASSLSSLPPLWIEHENQIYSFVLIRKGSDLASIEAISQQKENIRFINTLGTAVKALEAQRTAGSALLVLAYTFIAVLLFIYYRRISAVLLLGIPVAASVITIASVALLGQPITVFHIMALFLVLGLGMDYIIFAKEMKEQQATTQQAILLSAITSLLSFGLLAFSSMPVVQAFGSTILIGNTINFIAAISLFNQVHNPKENAIV
ncbi:MMPL family transporter [Glaciecola siphonariae]|uniref:MMPL family transporter n=1 Tax=Glaciecola siphonariae TaxID=521012 RepID=A0ABV9M0Y7_9ALTE